MSTQQRKQAMFGANDSVHIIHYAEIASLIIGYIENCADLVFAIHFVNKITAKRIISSALGHR